ncbi:hypothetical protein E4T43_09512 [Aureobasidium subglaciale]|nr:hypothetical protein E4T43_09512 [Aureobasidium subglaciale]
MKDIHVTINSTWTIEGRRPPTPEPVPEQETPSSSLRKGRRNERSEQASADYQETRGIFWNEGRHREITYSVAARWREAIVREGGSVKNPPRSIVKLIKRDDERLNAQYDRQQAEKKKGKGVPLQASPSVSQVFYVGSHPSAQSQEVETPQPPRAKSTSPIPVDLDNGAGWLAFWTSCKASVRSTRPEAWQTGLDRAMAALDADFWTLAMLFKATEGQLERVVPQTGLRMLIHDHLSKFISAYKDSQLAAPRQLISGGTTPRIISSGAQEISSDSSSSDDSNFDDDLLNDEHQSDTSDGKL